MTRQNRTGSEGRPSAQPARRAKRPKDRRLEVLPSGTTTPYPGPLTPLPLFRVLLTLVTTTPPQIILYGGKSFMDNLELAKMANEIRKGIVTAVHSAKAGHAGGSLSAADIFTYLYFEEMNIDPENPDKPEKDRFVLSKGHTAPGLYSTLAHRGFFPVEDLTTLRKLGSYLQGHPCMQHIPGVDMSTGSLGQGISAAAGMALGGKLDNRITAYIPFWATVKSKKDRYGKQPCSQVSISWTTW